jgi:hypothetical protein
LLKFAVFYWLTTTTIDAIIMRKVVSFTLKIFGTGRFIDAFNYPAIRLLG